MNDFTTTNKKKVRPDVLVYCRDVLVIIGEEKAANSTLATAAADLDYYFKFWNMLAFGDLLVFAFAAVGSQIQFYYFHVVESSTTPKRERIGGVLSLGTEVKRNNYHILQLNIIRIIRTFDHYGVVKNPFLKLFNVIHRNNGTTITIHP
ncbi:unnamed protein product [Rhizophagus irregularis]|nr:hypothetical protein RhiirB3_379632 [Rhizophagus irregularis]CAB4485431.1 unnamed protein product [Rhizophagus irregularis]CAB5191635.1 unnamed protein product [Rhizophagus irregularis]CAB5356521.1 unnamed protein product [Rhizophagus irregularis]